MSRLLILVLVSLLIAIISLNPFQILEKFNRHTLISIFDRPTTLQVLANRYRQQCPDHRFTSVKRLTRIYPEITIIEDFLTKEEADILIDLAKPLFGHSEVLNYENGSSIDKNYRSSMTAFLPLPENKTEDGQAIINCIEQRASVFQGYIPVENLENLQVVKYEQTQQFREHYDWFDPNQPGEEMDKGGNRLSSFFVYLRADCQGGPTAFLKVPRPQNPEWCSQLNCSVDHVEVYAKVGTAIFWYDLDPWGAVDEYTLHAGMPVLEGTKIGLNIWTREGVYRK